MSQSSDQARRHMTTRCVVLTTLSPCGSMYVNSNRVCHHQHYPMRTPAIITQLSYVGQKQCQSSTSISPYTTWYPSSTCGHKYSVAGGEYALKPCSLVFCCNGHAPYTLYGAWPPPTLPSFWGVTLVCALGYYQTGLLCQGYYPIQGR